MRTGRPTKPSPRTWEACSRRVSRSPVCRSIANHRITDHSMPSLPDPLLRLIEELQKLPGIGPKGAQRLAFHILRTPREQADRLVEAVRDVKERVSYCSTCNNITDVDPCAYCSADNRDRHIICVVE